MSEVVQARSVHLNTPIHTASRSRERLEALQLTHTLVRHVTLRSSVNATPSPASSNRFSLMCACASPTDPVVITSIQYVTSPEGPGQLTPIAVANESVSPTFEAADREIGCDDAVARHLGSERVLLEGAKHRESLCELASSVPWSPPLFLLAAFRLRVTHSQRLADWTRTGPEHLRHAAVRAHFASWDLPTPDSSPYQYHHHHHSQVCLASGRQATRTRMEA